MAEHCRQPGTWLAAHVQGGVAIDERSHKAVLYARWHRDQGYGRNATGNGLLWHGEGVAVQETANYILR